MKSLNENIIYLFLICLLFGFIFQLYYLTEPLLDFHSFRQTQTAITSYWFLKEDFKFAYQTPLFGFPWSIPMEFPLYQFIVYLFVKIFNISNLDFTGRIVSLTFYYALFYPFWNILKNFRINTEDIVIIFIFLVTSPIYIFWSRTFMIESTGLFFTLMFLMYVLKYDQEKYINFKLLSMILLFGILAVLTKITSLLVGLLFLSFFTIFFHKIKYLICKKNLLLIVFLTLIIFIGFIWNNFADITKSENHLSEFLMSNNLTSWNFGTFEQRLEIINYKIILNHIINNTPLFFLILPFLFFKTIIKNDYKKLIFISILTYLSTFLILFNLYKVHNYYWYANSIFLIILIGLITSSIVNIFKKNFYKYLIIIFFIGINFFVYYNFYFKSQISNTTEKEFIKMAKFIDLNTNENSIILIKGLDWDASLPYYSKRKAIMLRDNIDLDSIEIINVIQKSTINYKLEAIIMCNKFKYSHFDINLLPLQNLNKTSYNQCNIYTIKDEK